VKTVRLNIPGEDPIEIEFTDDEFAIFCKLAQAKDFDALDRYLLDHKPEFYGPIFEYWAHLVIDDDS